MKLARQPNQLTKIQLAVPIPVLWLVLLFALLGMGASACTGEADIPAVVVSGDEVMESTATLEATKPALQAAEEPTSTSMPENTPTFTPLPTATNTLVPSPTTTATATVDLMEVFEEPTEIANKPQATVKPPPLPTPSGVYSWTLKVPILMYHYVSEPPEDADKYRRDLSVTPADFEQQMAYLVENGFESVDLNDLSLAITNKRELPERPVIITLDDGYQDNYDNAFPILQNHGLSATFFVVTEFIDDGREGYLRWEMVEEMAAAGMHIEPHSKTHPDLSGQEREYVIYEVLGSQETIAAHTGETPLYFCYPGGSYDDQTIEILQELGFWGAVTTADGEWHGFNDRFEWSRIRMRNTTTLPEFADMVDPAETVSGKPAVDS